MKKQSMCKENTFTNTKDPWYYGTKYSTSRYVIKQENDNDKTPTRLGSQKGTTYR